MENKEKAQKIFGITFSTRERTYFKDYEKVFPSVTAAYSEVNEFLEKHHNSKVVLISSNSSEGCTFITIVVEYYID